MKEVRQGYKMSELGEIPSDWEVETIGNISNFVGSGVTPKGGENVYVTEGIPFIRSQNVYENKLFLDNVAYIDSILHEKMIRTEVHAKDILLNITGASIGRATMVPEEFDRGNVNQHVCIIRGNKNIAPKYLSYFINSSKIQKQIDSYNGGSSREGLNFQQIRGIKLNCPPLPEQQKIADILSTVDEQIDNVDQLIEKTKELKKGLMQQLLTKGIGHTEFKETEVGVIPKEWEVKKLAELYVEPIRDFGSFSTTKLIDYVEDGVPYLRSENFRENRLILNSVSYITNEVDKLLNKSYVYEGNVLFTKIGNIGCAYLYKGELGSRCNSNATIAKIKVNEQLCDKEYLVYFLNSDICKKQYVGDIVSTPPRVNMGRINEFKILMPSIKEQKQISDILISTDKKLSEINQKRIKLEAIKKGLMQQLLTGKIRVKTTI